MRGFVNRHKEDWDALEALVHRARRWGRRLTAQEREQLDMLYRRVTVHLAVVRTRTNDAQLISYLNRLAGAAHSIIYLPSRETLLSRVGTFFAEGFARSVARSGRQHLLSALLLLGGGLLGFLAASSDPLLAHSLWPRGDARQPGSTPDQLLEHLRAGREDTGGVKFVFASFLFQHNLRVGILAMAAGFLAAIPTVFLMLFNGMLLGAFVAIHYQAGIRAEMWAWLLPHGVTELGAIVLCGGVGLMLGEAVVRPGQLSRREALRQAGREAARTCCGVAAMLCAAAVIESYIRQSHWSTAARLLFAGATAFFWAAYFFRGWYLERSERLHHATTDSALAARQTG